MIKRNILETAVNEALNGLESKCLDDKTDREAVIISVAKSLEHLTMSIEDRIIRWQNSPQGYETEDVDLIMQDALEELRSLR